MTLGGPLFRRAVRPYSGEVKRALLLCLLLPACGVPQPSNVEVDPPAGADDAAAIVVQEWSERLGVELDVADLPLVRWFEGPCLDYGDGDPFCADGGYSTSALGDPEIHVIARDPVHSSRLAHEVLHWALEQATGDGDEGHADPAWDQVDAVVDVLRSSQL